MQKKACSKCSLVKTADNFSPNKNTRSGLASSCKKCSAGQYRKWAVKERKYDLGSSLEESVSVRTRLLRLKYSAMVERCAKFPSYLRRGVSVGVTIEEFVEFGLSSETFEKLIRDYVESGFERRLAPSIDRIDVNKGYVLDNMQFITQGHNSRKDTVKRKRNLLNGRLI